jgi:FkbM family methyltransferase
MGATDKIETVRRKGINWALRRLKIRIIKGLQTDAEKSGDCYKMSDDEFEFYLTRPDYGTFYNCKHYHKRYPRFVERLEPGDTLIKIGAGVGADLHQAAKNIGKEGNLYTVEANEENYKCLLKNLELHSPAKTRTELCAITDNTNKNLTLQTHDETHTSHQIHEALDAPTEKQTNVKETATIDGICEKYNISDIKILSITINGYEPVALRGATDTLSKTDFVVVPHGDKVQEILQSKGFDIVDEGRAGRAGALYKNNNS